MNFYDLSDGFSRSCMRLESLDRYILSQDFERPMTVYLITFYYDQIVIWRCDGSRIFAWSTLGLAIHQWYRRWMLQKVATWPSHYISDGNIAILLTGSHRTNTKWTIFNCVRHIFMCTVYWPNKRHPQSRKYLYSRMCLDRKPWYLIRNNFSIKCSWFTRKGECNFEVRTVGHETSSKKVLCA